MRQDIACFIKDHGQLARNESMIDIIMHPSLQQTSFQRAPRATAINEALQNVSHFSDVKMRGDKAAVWQQELDRLIRMCAQRVEKFSDVHEVSVTAFLHRLCLTSRIAMRRRWLAGAEMLFVIERGLEAEEIRGDLEQGFFHGFHE